MEPNTMGAVVAGVAAATAAVSAQIPVKHIITPEEREMMQDPSTVNCRIFVGCLPTDHMTKQNLMDLFSSFGNVLGVLMNRGFGFVQFDSEMSAKDAIANNGRIHFRGKKIDVKPARPLRKNNTQSEERDRSPIHDRDGHVIGLDRGREPTRFPVTKPRMLPTFTNPVSCMDRANDCEIIVINKEQTGYAEFVEGKLRKLGLTVDLLFPNEDCPVSRVITNIANKGCLFAIVVQPQNEEHRSITINILFGPQQEHRNMPLTDAMALVSRSFQNYLLREKSSRPSEVPVTMTAGSMLPPNAQVHPEAIQTLINLLAENRPLTVLQYEKIIAYLQTRREVQIKIELGDSVPPPAPVVPVANTANSGGTTAPTANDKQAELQSRILSILNTKAAAVAAAAGAAATTSASSLQAPPAAAITTTSASTVSTKPTILSDPAVQKALSSLFPQKQFS